MLVTACCRKRVCKPQFCVCCFIRTPIVCDILVIFGLCYLHLFRGVFIDYVISFFWQFMLGKLFAQLKLLYTTLLFCRNRIF